MSARLAVLPFLLAVAACAANNPPPQAAPPDEHHHDLHLPPVGPTVHLTFEGKSADVTLATVPHQGDSIPLPDLWKAAFPSDDPAALHFDLVGSDGFRPMSRSKCTKLLSGAEIAAGRVDVVTHNVSYDDSLSSLPGCYRVKAVVGIDASR